MRSVAKALKEFAGSFGVPAYSQSSVPDDISLPYIVYPMTEPEWNQKVSFYLLIWARTTGYSDLLDLADQIQATVGRGYKIPLENDGGYLVLWPENPAIQELDDRENDTKGIYVNMSINAYHIPGV